MKQIILDADGAVYGRLCSFAAKQALEGNEIIIVNCEKAVITGRREDILGKYGSLRKKGGSSLKGPRHLSASYRMMKRTIRGMVPDFRVGIGREAFKRVMCYNGVPTEFVGKKMIKSGKIKHDRYIQLNELSKTL
ncbi:MAG: 50S ribosomal protein L13 [Candidatus Pacearchaeota archaeon]